MIDAKREAQLFEKQSIKNRFEEDFIKLREDLSAAVSELDVDDYRYCQDKLDCLTTIFDDLIDYCFPEF